MENKKMIKILTSLGFKKNDEGDYEIKLYFKEFEEYARYVALEQDDHYWGIPTVQVYVIDEEDGEDIISGEGLELAAFILQHYV